MSTLRPLLLSACLTALLTSCATRTDLARATPVSVADARRFDFESAAAISLRAAEPETTNPYAPTRARDAEVYSWQSEKRATCPPEASASNAELEPNVAGNALAALPERPSNPPAKQPSVSADSVVAGLRPAIHHCFAQWLDERIDARGSVRFALELGCAGEVEAISAENQGVDESTLGCLFSAVAPARFPPPNGGHATVLVPVVFKNAAR